MGNSEVSILLGEIIQVVARTHGDKVESCGFAVTTEVPAVCARGRYGSGMEKQWEQSSGHCTGLALCWQKVLLGNGFLCP